MFKKVLILGAVSAAVFTGAAQASDRQCTDVPQDKWLPLHEAVSKVAQQGYIVWGGEREGSCYEIKGVDRNGTRVRLLQNPANGELVPGGAKQDSQDSNARERGFQETRWGEGWRSRAANYRDGGSHHRGDCGNWRHKGYWGQRGADSGFL